MGYPKPSTSLKIDNSTAAGIVTSFIRQKESKAMDMGFKWVKDRVSQKHFLVYRESGTTNGRDYFTKKFPIISCTGPPPVRSYMIHFFTTVVTARTPALVVCEDVIFRKYWFRFRFSLVWENTIPSPNQCWFWFGFDLVWDHIYRSLPIYKTREYYSYS